MNIPNFAFRHHRMRCSCVFMEAAYQPFFASSIDCSSLSFPRLNISLSSSPAVEFCAEATTVKSKLQMKNPLIIFRVFMINQKYFLLPTPVILFNFCCVALLYVRNVIHLFLTAKDAETNAEIRKGF